MKKNNRPSTERQKKAVSYCEHWMKAKFTGNLDSFNEVSKYLTRFLKKANKRHAAFENNYDGSIVYHSPKKNKRG